VQDRRGDPRALEPPGQLVGEQDIGELGLVVRALARPRRLALEIVEVDAPLSLRACAPPRLESGRLTIGTPDANARPAKSVGMARFRAVLGDPGTRADEADVSLALDITDVREQGSLDDYTGELAVTSSLSFPVRCTSTPDPDVGSTCSVTTTADTLFPGTVIESQRSIWELDRVQVFDGGADGMAATSEDNTLFAVQGIFAP